MVCECTTNEWTDNVRQSKDGTEGAKEIRAVLEMGNLRSDLYYGDNYLDPVCLR